MKKRLRKKQCRTIPAEKVFRRMGLRSPRTVGEWIALHRACEGITMHQMAEQLGISFSRMLRIECDLEPPATEEVQRWMAIPGNNLPMWDIILNRMQASASGDATPAPAPC